jgi:hypothetical protein
MRAVLPSIVLLPRVQRTVGDVVDVARPRLRGKYKRDLFRDPLVLSLCDVFNNFRLDLWLDGASAGLCLRGKIRIRGSRGRGCGLWWPCLVDHMVVMVDLVGQLVRYHTHERVVPGNQLGASSVPVHHLLLRALSLQPCRL